jgi:hypothetical protein
LKKARLLQGDEEDWRADEDDGGEEKNDEGTTMKAEVAARRRACMGRLELLTRKVRRWASTAEPYRHHSPRTTTTRTRTTIAPRKEMTKRPSAAPQK